MDQAISFDPHRPKTVHALQCARGFAALLVVYYHASAIATSNFAAEVTEKTFWERLAAVETHIPVFGACGVDLFFVLSGYIIWTSTRAVVSTPLFYKRRIARIVPLYWIVTLVTALAVLAAPSLFRTLQFSLPHVAASFAFVPWRNPAFSATAPGAFTPLVVAGWTLNFEMTFYLLFGIVAPLKHRRLLTMLVSYSAFAALVIFLRPWISFLCFYDPFLFAEFLVGCLVAVLVESGWIGSPRLTAIGLALGATAFLIGDYVSPPVSRFFYSGLPAAVVVYALVALESRKRWQRMVFLEWLGYASYSIYLTQIFALSAVRFAWRPLAGGLVMPWVQLLFALSVIAASVVVGGLSFRFIERPSSRWAGELLGIHRPARGRASGEQVPASGALALRSL